MGSGRRDVSSLHLRLWQSEAECFEGSMAFLCQMQRLRTSKPFMVHFTSILIENGYKQDSPRAPKGKSPNSLIPRPPSSILAAISSFKMSSAVHTSDEIPFDVTPLTELLAGKDLLTDLKISGSLLTSKSAYNSFVLVWIRFSATRLGREDERHDLPRIFLDGNLLNPSHHPNPEIYKVQIEELLTNKDFTHFAEKHILQALPKVLARYKNGKSVPRQFAGDQAVEWAPTAKTAGLTRQQSNETDATEMTAEQFSQDRTRTSQASSSARSSSGRSSTLSLVRDIRLRSRRNARSIGTVPTTSASSRG
jgi:hypothetical protein